MKKVLAALNDLINVRFKAPKDALMKFYTVREEREKKMLLVLGVALLLFGDYWLFIQPVINVFTKKMPEIAETRRLHDELKADIRNERELKVQAGQYAERAEKGLARFVAAAEVPKLLEGLSGLARQSGVKIISVEPGETQRSRAMEPYGRVPIRLSAEAGFHELGRFLAALETSKTFFGIRGLKIQPNGSDLKRQLVELDLFVYRKG